MLLFFCLGFFFFSRAMRAKAKFILQASDVWIGLLGFGRFLLVFLELIPEYQVNPQSFHRTSVTVVSALANAPLLCACTLKDKKPREF